jgi:hypothetical protein
MESAGPQFEARYQLAASAGGYLARFEPDDGDL